MSFSICRPRSDKWQINVMCFKDMVTISETKIKMSVMRKIREKKMICQVSVRHQLSGNMCYIVLLILSASRWLLSK